MLTRIEKDQASGRQLKGIYIDDSNAAIVFYDGTYVGFEIESGYYGNKSLGECEIGRSEFTEAILVAAGFYTQEELDAIGKQEKAESRMRAEAEERARYERLKEKFEPKG